MSAPVKYGDEWKLTVRKSVSERRRPPAAASRVHSPSTVPNPTASSLSAISTPIGVDRWRRWPSSGCSGLVRFAATSCAWIPDGLFGSKKFGFASFCSPAKQNVIPRNARSGSSAQPTGIDGRADGEAGGHCRRRPFPCGSGIVTVCRSLADGHLNVGAGRLARQSPVSRPDASDDWPADRRSAGRTPRPIGRRWPPRHR